MGFAEPAGHPAAGGLLPHRFTLTKRDHPAIRLRGLLSGCLKVFLQMATEAHCTGGLFSVALSVAESLPCIYVTKISPLALPGALPFSLARHAPKTFVLAHGVEDYGVRTFLPACLLAKACPAITRPARQSLLYMENLRWSFLSH